MKHVASHDHRLILAYGPLKAVEHEACLMDAGPWVVGKLLRYRGIVNAPNKFSMVPCRPHGFQPQIMAA
jgi:hypothetical protein